MLQEAAPIQKRDNDNTDPLLLDQLQVHDQMIIPVFDIVILVETSALIELLKLNIHWIISIPKKFGHLFYYFFTKLAIILFLDPILDFDSTLEFINLHIDLRQDHFLDLRPHLGDFLWIIYKQTPLKILTTTMKFFEYRKTNLTLINRPLRWQML